MKRRRSGSQAFQQACSSSLLDEATCVVNAKQLAYSAYSSNLVGMGFAVRVRSAGQKYGPTCHQRDRADVTEFVTLVRLSSLGQHVGVLALAGYRRRKSALTANPIDTFQSLCKFVRCFYRPRAGQGCAAQQKMVCFPHFKMMHRQAAHGIH